MNTRLWIRSRRRGLTYQSHPKQSPVASIKIRKCARSLPTIRPCREAIQAMLEMCSRLVNDFPRVSLSHVCILRSRWADVNFSGYYRSVFSNDMLEGTQLYENCGSLTTLGNVTERERGFYLQNNNLLLGSRADSSLSTFSKLAHLNLYAKPILYINLKLCH
jgi:hypothetical protein